MIQIILVILFVSNSLLISDIILYKFVIILTVRDINDSLAKEVLTSTGTISDIKYIPVMSTNFTLISLTNNTNEYVRLDLESDGSVKIYKYSDVNLRNYIDNFSYISQ